jgi:AraC family transcriptional regulator
MSYLGDMAERPLPVIREMNELLLSGSMAVYESQIQLSERIPDQWRELRTRHPELGSNAELYGASPCTTDRKIHYFTGAAQEKLEDDAREETLSLHSGEYAVVRVENSALLRDTWTWLLESWLPASGRREKSAPEFERYAGMSEAGLPIAPIEIWVPLEPL